MDLHCERLAQPIAYSQEQVDRWRGRDYDYKRPYFKIPANEHFYQQKLAGIRHWIYSRKPSRTRGGYHPVVVPRAGHGEHLVIYLVDRKGLLGSVAIGERHADEMRPWEGVVSANCINLDYESSARSWKAK